MEIKIIRPKTRELLKKSPHNTRTLKPSNESFACRNKLPVETQTGDGLESGRAERLRLVTEIMGELNELIGLATVKKLVYEIMAFIEIQKKRQLVNLANEPLVLHMIFRGNPGTGKTTVARNLGKLFKQLNVLSKGHLVEIERADLVGEYIGHTAQKTREQLKKSIGGILFIDEAYSLARGGEKDFGKEAIDVIVKAMEDQKDNLILILAGYNDEMDEFINSNPGLKSRFPIKIDFPDYSIRELLDIADLFLKKRQYSLTPAAREALKRALEIKSGKGHELSGNARLVRNIIEKAIRRQAVRLMENTKTTREDLMGIEESDISEARKQCLSSVSF